MIAQKGYKAVGIIGQDYSFGHEAVAALRKKIAQVSPAPDRSEIFHPAGTKDYAPYGEPVDRRQARCHFHAQLGQ